MPRLLASWDWQLVQWVLLAAAASKGCVNLSIEGSSADLVLMQPETRELCLRLGHLKDEDDRRALLLDHPELQSAGIVEALAEAVRTTVRVDVPQALALAEAALTVATQLKDDTALARALRP